jgi:hypothetical protein
MFHIYGYFFSQLYVQKVDVIIETSEENQDRHLWQAGFTRNITSPKERVILGHAFHLSSSHFSNLTVKNSGSLGVKPEELNVCQNMHLTSRTEGIHAGEKPYQCNKYGKFFVQKSRLTKCEIIYTGRSLTSVISVENLWLLVRTQPS